MIDISLSFNSNKIVHIHDANSYTDVFMFSLPFLAALGNTL